MPEVSIIMNCLNGAAYLGESLQSAARQTFADFEIIFWDNCSTDNSAEMAQSFGPRLRYHRSEKTIPLGQARNCAIAAASGAYIAFLDTDDLWEPTKLARQIEIMKANPKVGLVTCDTRVFNEGGLLHHLFDQSQPARGMVFDDLILRQWIAMSSALLSREALDAVAPAPEQWFDESLNVCEEADLFYRIAHEFELDYAPEALAGWRVHGMNTTFRKFGQFAAETRAILAKHRSLYPDYDLVHKAASNALAERAAFQESINLWQNGQGAAARQILAPHLGKHKKYRLFHMLTLLPGSFFEPIARLYFSLPAWLRK